MPGRRPRKKFCSVLFRGFFLLIFFPVIHLPKGCLYIFYLLLIEKPAIAGSFKFFFAGAGHEAITESQVSNVCS